MAQRAAHRSLWKEAICTCGTFGGTQVAAIGRRMPSLAGYDGKRSGGERPTVDKMKKSLADNVCQGLPKNGGDLLSQLVGQYHRRG